VVPRLNKPICHVNLARGYSGGERQTEILVRELGRRGWHQRLVACAESGLAERCAEVPGLEIRLVSRSGLSAAFALRGSCLVHAHDGRSVYAALGASLLLGIPYVVTRRVVTGKSITGARAWAYNRAARVVAISNATEVDMRQGGLKVPVVIVADAAADLAFDPVSAAAVRSRYEGKTLIGHAGNLDHTAKGQSTIIEVAHRAATEQPNWHFLLCGEGRDRERFEREIGDLGNIELVGWVDNIGDYLEAFDLFVFPSPKEALGSAMLDALQRGLPIVASRVGGIPDIVEDGVNGRLVEPENAGQLYAAIEAILADGDELEAIRARNIEKSQDFSATHMADAYETLYREIEPSM
jgi:glycosyltransferase involved in cell wall biosynthesis